MDRPRPGLKYVDADDLDDTTIDFDGLDVVDSAGEEIGSVDGFILDVHAARPYYVVVNAGGWFKSKYFLLPIGQVSLDRQRKKLVADLSRDRVNRFPGFDRDEFDEVTDDELRSLDEEMITICASAETVESSTVYRTPTWWESSYYLADPVADATIADSRPSSRARAISEAERRRDPEEVVARDSTEGGDVSPHLGGRAQPGDVLGVETGGERSYIGDTSEDENERRRDAEKAASKLGEDRKRK